VCPPTHPSMELQWFPHGTSNGSLMELQWFVPSWNWNGSFPHRIAMVRSPMELQWFVPPMELQRLKKNFLPPPYGHFCFINHSDISNFSRYIIDFLNFCLDQPHYISTTRHYDQSFKEPSDALHDFQRKLRHPQVMQQKYAKQEFSIFTLR